MIHSKESLEWIVDAIIRGNKVPNHSSTTYDSATGYYPDKIAQNQSRIRIQQKPSFRINKEGLFVS